MHLITRFFGTLTGWFLLSGALAQSLTPTEQQQIIDQLLSLLQQRYVFPDVAEKCREPCVAKPLTTPQSPMSVG